MRQYVIRNALLRGRERVVTRPYQAQYAFLRLHAALLVSFGFSIICAAGAVNRLGYAKYQSEKLMMNGSVNVHSAVVTSTTCAE